MNRLAMAREIDRLVPMLTQLDRSELKEAERLRKQFVSDYPIKIIPGLKRDEYVIGKGANNHSFCYRLEREMDKLGRILGATAFKFGVYFGHTKSDLIDRYRFAKHWGANFNEAFASVKQAIVDLLKAAAKEDLADIAQNKLSPMFKGKILFLYHPNQYAPIYSWPYLKHFYAALNLNDDFECEADMQRALMRYRAKWPKLRNQHPVLYQRFLYEVFENPKYATASGQAMPSIPLLRKAVEGAQFIDKMPASPPGVRFKFTGRGKSDYAAQQRNSRRIGDRGELVVLALEKQWLISSGKTKLARYIDHVAQREDGLGYDILSFETDGRKRPIEVKATNAPNLQNGFYITANELEKSRQLPNYYLYLVFSATSKSPRVFIMKKPNLKGSGFVLQPLNYHVTHPKSVE